MAFPPRAERLRLEQLDQTETIYEQHGRIERRTLQTSTRLAAHLDWPGVAQVCWVNRQTWRDGKWVHETAYSITSVPRTLGDDHRGTLKKLKALPSGASGK